MTTLEDTELGTVTGGGIVGTAGKVVGAAGTFAGRAWPWVDVVTSAYDGYWSYNQARAENKSVSESLGSGTKNFLRSLSMYDIWSQYCGTAQ